MDSIHDVKPLSKAERRAILAFLDQGVDLEDVLRRSVQLLSQLTRQAAVVQLPTLKVSRVRHCEVVELTPTRLLLVLITDTGRVDQRNVELGEQLAPEKVARLKDNLNRRLSGKTLAEASVAMADMAVDAPPDLRNASIRCATVLVETLVEAPSERLILSGASHLFPSGLPSVVEALEEQVVVLKLLSSAQNVGQVQVSIGDEELRGAAVVAAGYGATGATLGGMGVVGPNYMDYSGTMSKVSAVAQYVGRVLAGQ